MFMKLFSSTVNSLTGKRAKVIWEDGNKNILLFLSQNERHSAVCDELNDACEVIEHCQLIDIEDGLFHLVYVHNGKMVSGIMDLHRHSLKLTCAAMDDSMKNHDGFSQKSGSFHLVTDLDQPNNVLITNEEKALDFWIRYFDLHDESAIDDYLTEPYIQHNPNVADGVEAFRNEFHNRFSTDMRECTTIVKRVSSRDDLVFIHNILKRSTSVKGHAAVDIFRFENGKIVEHWDVIQPMPETSKNDHPMF